MKRPGTGQIAPEGRGHTSFGRRAHRALRRDKRGNHGRSHLRFLCGDICLRQLLATVLLRAHPDLLHSVVAHPGVRHSALLCGQRITELPWIFELMFDTICMTRLAYQFVVPVPNC